MKSTTYSGDNFQKAQALSSAEGSDRRDHGRSLDNRFVGRNRKTDVIW